MVLAAFWSVQADLLTNLYRYCLGKELMAPGFETDIKLAAVYNVSDCVPVFTSQANLERV